MDLQRLKALRIALLLAAGVGSYALGAPRKSPPRDPNTQNALNDTNISKHWIYNDIDKAILEAEKNGKPLLAVIRCVP